MLISQIVDADGRPRLVVRNGGGAMTHPALTVAIA